MLAGHFLNQHAQRYRKPLAGFEPAALQLLAEHPWPGNVRELDHAVERAALMAEGSLVKAADLQLRPAEEAGILPEEMSLEEMERFLIRKALARHDGNAKEAAEALAV